MTNRDQIPFWVITGAASGIGAAVTQQVAESGARVLALDVDNEKGRSLSESTGAAFLSFDVSDYEQWQQLQSKIKTEFAEWGAPTRLHLNAGIQIAPPTAPLSDYQLEAMTLDRYQKMMGVNVDGVVFGLKAMLPLMGAGSAVVVTASLAGVTPYTVDPLYAMSKHAMVGLVRSMGPILKARGIAIHALCPGGVDTSLVPLAQKGNPAAFMTPQTLADDVVALMTEEESGKSWVRLRTDKPKYIIRAPGDKQR